MHSACLSRAATGAGALVRHCHYSVPHALERPRAGRLPAALAADQFRPHAHAPGAARAGGEAPRGRAQVALRPLAAATAGHVLIVRAQSGRDDDSSALPRRALPVPRLHSDTAAARRPGWSRRTQTTARCRSWLPSGSSRQTRMRCWPGPTGWWAPGRDACLSRREAPAIRRMHQMPPGVPFTGLTIIVGACGSAVRQRATGWASVLPDRHLHFHSQRARGALRRPPATTPSRLTAVQEAYDLALARFYMWAQTDAAVFLAIHSPTGAPQAGRRAAPARLQAAARERRALTAPVGSARQGMRTGSWCWRPAPARSSCRRRARRPWWTARSRTASTRRTRLRPSGARARGRLPGMRSPLCTCTVPGQHPHAQPQAGSDGVEHM